eukprot:CAMPEP_0170562212 /NCGR_PEP_ID=MMETSP0211-20121228/59429_1 /TAXON_ID=311385 /ORGANISM="Pseudokeronopsis sp., Strain OXSARD2" /LENGTH=84 /DNA_ID=CAMNT_0010878813 /DNA_START=15 /DNA_END=265 /DNA_ORIENTATION=+
MAMNFGLYYTFFPGVLLMNEMSIFDDFAWFSITIITIANVSEATGRYLGGKYLLIPKKLYLPANIVKLVFVIPYTFTAMGLYSS